MKKLLSIILALAMVFSVVAFETVLATTEPTITVETVEAEAGETVAVKVSISNNPGIWGLKVKIAYDRSVLTLTSVENGDFFASSEWTKGDINKETYTLSYGANDFADITTVSGTLATLTFSVSDTATAGDYNIDVSYVVGDIINSNLDDVSFAMVNGKVSIKEEAPANPEGILQYLTYTIENDEVTITDCDETVSGDIEIPATIEGYPVTKIGYGAFSFCADIQNIKLPESICYIGDAALENCTSLVSVNIPQNVSYIGWYCFNQCYKLESIELPMNITCIESQAFGFCKSLTSITVPEGVKIIVVEAFLGCENLETVYLPNTLEGIGSYAFRHCNGLNLVEYNGTEEEWNNIEIDMEGNEVLENVTITFLKEPIQIIEGTITGATVDIGSSLTINYFADAPENTVMKFTSSSGRVTEVNGVYDEKTGYYKFAYTGINPQCMNDVIKAELMNGETVLDTKESYSVKDYCENQAGKTAGELKLTNGQYEAFKTLMADMLVYGSAAQKYRKYNTENLSDTSEWIDAYKSTFNTPTGVKRISGNTDSENKVKSVGLNMANVNRIYFKLILNDESVVVTLNDQIIDVSALAKNNDGTYMLYSPDVFATGFSDVYTLKLTKNGEVISTVEYNVNAYIEAKCETNGLIEILKSLSNYGNAAKAYQNVSTDGDFDLDEDEI